MLFECLPVICDNSRIFIRYYNFFCLWEWRSGPSKPHSCIRIRGY